MRTSIFFNIGKTVCKKLRRLGVKMFMTKWVATLLLVVPFSLLADDMDDVMAVIEAYGDLEATLQHKRS